MNETGFQDKIRWKKRNVFKTVQIEVINEEKSQLKDVKRIRHRITTSWKRNAK